jgi:peptide/nickel transport system substrate-binding protein
MLGRQSARKFWKASLAAVAAVALSLSAFAGIAAAQTASTSSPHQKLIFRVGVPGDMISPNPLLATNGDDYETLFNAYDMLFNFSPTDLTPAPGLATKCDHSSDYMTWTCNIRSGVTWSDGQPLTAEDIAFTYTFIETTDKNQVFTGYIPYNPTFTAPNATTLIWQSTKPTFAPTVPPWVPILPEHIWKQFEGNPKAARAFSNVPAVGSGPFVLTSWTQGQGWTMEANKQYWGGAPTIDEIQYKVFGNQEAMVQALKSGDIDFADNLNPTLFNSLKSAPNIGTNKGAPPCFTNLAFNFGGQGKDATNNPVLKDLNMRLAIAKAINKQTIIDKVWLGDAQVGSVITLPSRPVWFYTPNDLQTQAYDPTGANALLDQSGYSKKNSAGIRLDKNGKPIVLRIFTLPEETGSVDTGKLIQAELQQVGIGVHLISVSDKQLENNNWYSGDFDAYVWGWCGDPDPDFILSIFTTSQCLGWSDGCYSNPAYDQMYVQQKAIFDRTQRVAFIGKMQQFIFDQIPEIVLNYSNYLQAYRTDTYTGYIPTPKNGGAYLFGWGPYSYINLKPVSGAVSHSSSGIPKAVVLLALGVLLAIVVTIVLTRRRRGEEEA